MHRVAALSAARHVTRHDSRNGVAAGPSAAAAAAAASLRPAAIGAMPLPLSRDMIEKLALACRRMHTIAPCPRSPLVATPLSSPQHSRRVSFSRPSGCIPARVIAPFMPTRFVQTRGSERVRVRDAQQQQQQPHRTGSSPVVQPASSPFPWQQQQQQQAGGQPTTAPFAGTGETAASRVIGNVGLSDFLGRVYKTTGLSVAASLGGSYALAALLGPAAFGPALIGGLVTSLGAMFAMYKIQPSTQRDAAGRLLTVNPPNRQVAFAAFVAGNSLMLVPLVAMTAAISPLIIPVAAGAAGLTMLGSSLYAYRQPNGSMLSLAAPLTGALGASIVLGIAGMAASAIVGPNLFSSVVFSVYPYVSIGIFSVLTAVDTHTAISEYEQGHSDHLWHAVGFYLNFVNLLSSFARIISSIVRDD